MYGVDILEQLKEREKIIQHPDEDNFIWRYYSLDKFLALLSSSQLFFAPANTFEDPFEGDYGVLSKTQIRDVYGDGQYERDLNTYEFLRVHTYISCWHHSQHESDAMWKIYGGSVAIKARYKNVKSLLNWSESEVKYSGLVNYIDYEKDPINVDASYVPYFYKRNSFVHEREVRFLIQEHRYDWDQYPEPSIGKYADININELIEEIVISPTAENFVSKAIKDVIERFNITVPVKISNLLRKPAW